MKKIKERLFTKGKITSLLGLVIVLTAIASVFIKENMSWGDVSVGIVLGVSMFLMKDEKLINLFKK